MAKKYSKTDISVMKEALFHDMCPAGESFCPDCPYEGGSCPDNIGDDDIIKEYETRFGPYSPRSARNA